MTDEVKAEVIRETQNVLGKFIKKPTLTEKLLKKPPFRFLHDICTSVMKETGFFENILTSDDNIENIKDKEGKMEFLQKVIAAVEAASGIKLTVKPNKVVAGLEATKTNELLQALGKVLENRTETKSSKVAPPKTKASKKLAKEVKEEPPDKKKVNKSKKIIENGMKETVEKNGVETLSPPEKKHSNKKSNQTTPKEDEKSQKKIKSEREEASVAKDAKGAHGAGESKDLPDVDIIRVNGVDGQGDQNMTVKEEITDAEQRRHSEKHKRRRSSMHNVQDETKHEEVMENNENLKPKADSFSDKTLNEKILSNRSELPLKERNITPNSASQSNYPKKDANLMKEGALVSRPRTGIRTTTARPASARPAAPRIRDRGEVAVTEEVIKPSSGKVQVIVDDETANEEDENLISLEMSTDILLEEPPSTIPKSEPPKEEHGHLVEQILDVQRELEDNSRFSEQKTSKKTEIEWESGRNRESTNREIEKLRINIQNLTRTANPLGKLLDFFQEDIEIVQKELETWREKNIQYCSQIAQEKSTTNRFVEPLKVHLKELQQNIDEQLHQISAVKANIIRNDEKIHKLLAELSKYDDSTETVFASEFSPSALQMECPYGNESLGERLSLKDLPVHVLFIVFENLDLRSLLALCRVCKSLYYLIKEEYLNAKSFSLLVTNQVSAKFQKKSLTLLSGSDKYRLNFHWRKKYYRERIFLKSVERYRPWLRLDTDNLFISRGSEIVSFKRNKNGIIKKPVSVFKGHCDDVVRFVVKDGIMISGGNDGKICCWNPQKGRLLFHVKNLINWNENLYVDFSNKTLVSGFSIFGTIKFWTITENHFCFKKEVQLNARLRCIALSEDGAFCSVGSSGYETSPLTIFDLNKEVFSISISERFKAGAGIFDIIWETPNVLLTCGYDSFLRMWDIRIGQCVKAWVDPYGDAISSLASDYNWTIMSGSGIHSRVTLWDKRLSSHVDIYHMKRSVLTGPVYSFDFDPTFLFVALDSSLHVLNFSSKPAVPHIL